MTLVRGNGGKVLTVNRLSDNRVLIILAQEEMQDFSLDFSRMDLGDSHARRVLTRLTRMACRKSGIATDGQRLNIEALSLGEGCYLLITVGGARRYRLKQSGARICCTLQTSGDLLNAVAALYRSGAVCRRSSAYAYRGGYCLLFAYPSLPHTVGRILSEYGSVTRKPLYCAAVAEHGRLLCPADAVEIIGKAVVGG